jgi:hypothetical protein
MGMTFQQYWYEDPCLVIAYRKAYDMKREYDNSMLWLQGRYFYDALLAVAPRYNNFKPKKPAKYNEEPYPITENMRNRQEIEKTRKAAAKMLEKAKRHNAELAKNGGDINGGRSPD